jgi:hypothetical protein
VPSVSGAQHRFFELIDHNPAAAMRLGVPQSVAHDFVEADRGRKFAWGGPVPGTHYDQRRRDEYPHAKLAEILARRT